MADRNSLGLTWDDRIDENKRTGARISGEQLTRLAAASKTRLLELDETRMLKLLIEATSMISNDDRQAAKAVDLDSMETERIEAIAQLLLKRANGEGRDDE